MPTAAPWADVPCRGSRGRRPRRPQPESGHRSRRSGKPAGTVCRSSPLPSCVLQLAPLSPAQAGRTTRGRPQLRPQDRIRSQALGSMAGSPGHQLADPDHQQWPPHNAQICAAGAERGIDAATAPNGGYACAVMGYAPGIRDQGSIVRVTLHRRITQPVAQMARASTRPPHLEPLLPSSSISCDGRAWIWVCATD